MIIIAFDPGETTGYVKFQVDGELDKPRIVILEVGEYGDSTIPENALDGVDRVICEDFVNRGSYLNTIPLEMIGQIKLLTTLAKLPGPIMRRPAQKDVVDRWFPKLIPATHWGDACRHAIQYVVKDLKFTDFYFKDNTGKINTKVITQPVDTQAS